MSPLSDSAAATTPAVLVPLTISSIDVTAAVLDAVGAAGAGATGVDLRFTDAQLAVASGIGIADQIAETAGLTVFLRTEAPLAAGAHTMICLTDGESRRGNCVVDLGIDELGASPDSDEVAARWPDPTASDLPPFLISTVGFESLADAELMALATVATVRGAVAITSPSVRTVRRVVDTVSAVLRARSAS